MTYIVIQGDELYHHGILGQKWGIRRYQNPDGSLTDEGKKRYMRHVKRIAIRNNPFDGSFKQNIKPVQKEQIFKDAFKDYDPKYKKKYYETVNSQYDFFDKAKAYSILHKKEFDKYVNDQIKSIEKGMREWNKKYGEYGDKIEDAVQDMKQFHQDNKYNDTSFEFYLSKSPGANTEWKNILDKTNKAYASYEKEIDRCVSKLGSFEIGKEVHASYYPIRDAGRNYVDKILDPEYDTSKLKSMPYSATHQYSNNHKLL